MSLRKIYRGVEEQIQEAIAKGDFDNLPGKGKPLDLSGWKKTPAHLRMGYSMLKSAGLVPVEIQAKKEIVEIKKKLAETEDKEERMRLTNRLNSLTATAAIKADSFRSSS